jgi:hypothetical protein
MRPGINEPVSVVWYYNAKLRHMQPYMLTWNNQDYHLGKIDFWHKTWDGKHQIHHFSIADKDGNNYFKLALNTDTLNWTLEEYMTAHDAYVTYRRELA